MTDSPAASRKQRHPAIASGLALLLAISSAAQADRVINSVTVDGGSSTTVTAGATVTVELTVTTSGNGANRRWRSTSYTLDGVTTCHANATQFTTAGTHVYSFEITVPAGEGDYTLSVFAHRNNNCAPPSDSNLFTLNDAIEVDSGGVGGGGSGVAAFVIGHDGSGIHCAAENVAVSAVDSSGNPVPDYAGTITLDTQSGRGTWSLWSGAGAFEDAVADDGVASYTFSVDDAGTATFNLDYSEGSSPIDVDVFQSNDTSLRDNDGEGLLIFAPSGFTLTAGALSNPPSNPIDDALGPQVAGAAFALHIAAYGTTDTDPECGVIESYAGPRQLQFTMAYDDPATGGRVATVDGSDVNTGLDQAVSFSNGQAQVTVRYKDVGRIVLGALDEGSFENSLTGFSNAFVVQPATFAITRIESAGGVANPEAATLSGDAFLASGVAFTVEVEARDVEGDPTPNYGNEATPEGVRVFSSSLVLPAGGRNGSEGDVINGTAFTEIGDSGVFTNSTVAFDEYGIIRLQASVADGDYLGTGNVIGALSNNVGRFVPARFALSAGAIPPSCGNFSYMDQRSLALDYTLSALNTLGGLLENYDLTLIGAAVAADVTLVAEAEDNGIDLGARIHAPASVWSSGVHALSTTAADFIRSGLPDGPYRNVQIGVRLHDAIDGLTIDAPTMNAATVGDCVAAANCNARPIGGVSDFYYGRLALAPGVAPETRDMNLALSMQYYDGSSFATLLDDNCTTYAAEDLSLNPSAYSGNLGAGETAVLPLPPTSVVLGEEDPGAPLRLSAPGLGNDGAGEIRLDVPAWLEFDWRGSGDTDPTARIVFGRFRGHDRIVYKAEM